MMDAETFKKCVERIKVHIESGDSFTLAKTKAMRELRMSQHDAKSMSLETVYQKLKSDFKLQHRNDQSWTNNLENK